MGCRYEGSFGFVSCGESHDVVDLDDPEKTLLYRWVIKGDWKLLRSYDGIITKYHSSHPKIAGPQLFNLKDDPNENNNLASQNPKMVKKLDAELNKWYKLKRAKML